MKEHEFFKAKKVMLTGPSAGAVGVFLWSNYIQEFLDDPTGLTIVADSGSLFPYPDINGNPSFILLAQGLFSIINEEEKTPN